MTPSDPTAKPSDQRGPTWTVVLLAALLAAGLAVAAMAFLGSRNNGSDASPATTSPAEPADLVDAEPATDVEVEVATSASPAVTEVEPDAVEDRTPIDDSSTAPTSVAADAATVESTDAAADTTTVESADAAANENEPDAVDGDPGTSPSESGDAAVIEADTAGDPEGATEFEGTSPAENGDGATPDGAGDGHVVDDGSAVAEDVPESRAVVRNGQIYLEGAVPNQAASDEIEALAAEILGPDNVFNEYVIDERAGDPSLGNITVEDTINFATGSSVLLPESEPLLTQGLALMAIRPAVIIEIVGHTDDRGTDQYNQQLSEERAAAVKQWFVERGVEPGRLITSGAGESQPIADNSTEEGRRLNRRIQLFLQNILGDA